jgi:hypothetical protein
LEINMTNYIDELEHKQKPKGKKPGKQASGGSTQEHIKNGGNKPVEPRVPARKLFGDQGDFEDGTIKD